MILSFLCSLSRAGAEETKTLELIPDKSTIGIYHQGNGDDSTFIEHREALTIPNCPPAAIIKKIRVFGFLKITGSASEFKLKAKVNGHEHPALQLNAPGFMMDLFVTFNNNRDQKVSISGEELLELMPDGGNLTLEGIAQIRGANSFSTVFSNLKAEVTVISDTNLPFPANIDIPPIVDPAVSVPIRGKDFSLKNVFKDTKIHYQLLWDGSEVLTKVYERTTDPYELMRKVAAHKWTTAEFMNTNTQEGEHTIQWLITYTGADEEGYSTGEKTVYVPENPKKILVLKADSASDYYPTAFVNLYGPESVDEDHRANWSFSYQANFHKEAPNPVVDRTMVRAEAKAGILADSVTWSLDWGDGTELSLDNRHTPDKSKPWQDPVAMSHIYTVPGKYVMNMRLNYKIRRYKPMPNLEELQFWEPYDTSEEITTAKSVDVMDKTPPVILAEGYNVDAPPYGGEYDEPTDSKRDMHLILAVTDNCVEDEINKVKLFYNYHGQWLLKMSNRETLIPQYSSPGRKYFEILFKMEIPMNMATKLPEAHKMAMYMVVSDKSNNINDGDLNIMDNDMPPLYGADGRGPSGSMVIYDSIPPSVKVTYTDPSTGNLMEFATMPDRPSNTKRVFMVAAYETSRSTGVRQPLFEEQVYDVNVYPIMQLREIRSPLVFPREIEIIEDQRLHVDVDCSDLVDGQDVTLEFQVDGVTTNTSNRGKATIPIIFRNPGKKLFSIIARDKPNMDGSFNALRIDINTVVKDSRMTVQTIQSR